LSLTDRVETTILIGAGWLALIPLFLAFNPARLNLLQSAAAVLASGVIAIGTVALTWLHDSDR
jgi:hypothetical protein